MLYFRLAFFHLTKFCLRRLLLFNLEVIFTFAHEFQMNLSFLRGQHHSSFWYGEFQIPCNETESKDTFLSLTGWAKGVAFVNGFNIGISLHLH